MPFLKTLPHPARASTLGLVLVCIAFSSVAYAQTDPQTADNRTPHQRAESAISALKSGDFDIFSVEAIAADHDTDAIPLLKDLFPKSTDFIEKGKIAAALIRLGNHDDVYWDYLANEAKLSLECPFPFGVDAKGQPVAGGLSSEFLAWAASHNIPQEMQSEFALIGFGVRLMQLAESGDPRAIPLLRQGLNSPNHLVQPIAAMGLAKLQDKDSLPLIIDACKKGPAAAAGAMAFESLVFFDDPRAQAAAAIYLPKEMLKIFNGGKLFLGTDPFNAVSPESRPK